MQRMLAHRTPHSCHLFTDILDVFGDGAAAQTRFMEAGSLEEKLRVQAALPRHASAYCLKHDAMCPLETGCSLRVGGTPCQDWSLAGKRQGVQGVQMGPLMAFGAKSQHVPTPLLVLECTPGLPADVVHAAFGHSHSFQWPLTTVTSPPEVGFSFTSRPRFLVFTAAGKNRLERCTHA